MQSRLAFLLQKMKKYPYFSANLQSGSPRISRRKRKRSGRRSLLLTYTFYIDRLCISYFQTYIGSHDRTSGKILYRASLRHRIPEYTPPYICQRSLKFEQNPSLCRKNQNYTQMTFQYSIKRKHLQNTVNNTSHSPYLK